MERMEGEMEVHGKGGEEAGGRGRGVEGGRVHGRKRKREVNF